ncbi:MAG: Asp-tRNA(Asn)/Glu-tRNA(Gln) amidotransferase GatCAB subunit B, partial [Planctomycetaceae bacterium]
IPVVVAPEFLDEVRASLCEFPADRRRRLAAAFQLSDYDASVIVGQGRALADYYEEVAQLCGDGKQASNWVTQDVLRELNERNLEIGQFPLRASVLGNLLGRITAKQITIKSAREVFAALLAEHQHPAVVAASHIDPLIAERGLALVTDQGAIDTAIADVLARNPKIVTDFRGGKQGAIGPLVGQVMKTVKGADPAAVRQALADAIGRLP